MENNNGERLYVVSVYSENQVGLLSVIANVFTRRSLNIEMLTTLPSEFEGIHRFTIKTRTTRDKVESVVKHIEKKVDVIRAFWYVDDEYLAKEHAVIAEWIEQTRNKQLKKQ